MIVFMKIFMRWTDMKGFLLQISSSTCNLYLLWGFFSTKLDRAKKRQYQMWCVCSLLLQVKWLNFVLNVYPRVWSLTHESCVHFCLCVAQVWDSHAQRGRTLICLIWTCSSMHLQTMLRGWCCESLMLNTISAAIIINVISKGATPAGVHDSARPWM